jgi:hypothetical protein
MEAKEFDYIMAAEAVIEHLGGKEEVCGAIIISDRYFRLYTLKDSVKRLFPDQAGVDMELLYGAIYDNLKAANINIARSLKEAKRYMDKAVHIIDKLIFHFS